VPAAPSDLASVPLFESLSEAERAEVAAWFEVKEVGAGVRLCGEGTTGRSFFVIAEGEAAVAVRGDAAGTLGPGDFFGELALLGPGRRTASVTTTSPARVLVLFADDFRRLQTAYPDVAARIEATTKARLEQV
jgi:CRP-like cAMP-binding protein